MPPGGDSRSIALRVRVELRRHEGKWIPRYRPQRGIVGQLTTARRTIDGQERTLTYVTLNNIEQPQGVIETIVPPVLYKAEVSNIFGDEFRLMGMEESGKAWVLQEWDCRLLAPEDYGYK